MSPACSLCFGLFQHLGYGVDVRRRNIWDLYGSGTILKVNVIIGISTFL